MITTLRLLAISPLVSLAFVAITAVVARAHDEHDWIRSGGYRSPTTAEWCCGQDDCVSIPAADMEAMHGGGWLVMPTQERVPARETLPSQDGRFWRCHRPNGSLRCFFAPPGTS
jgi:hypothetical protein